MFATTASPVVQTMDQTMPIPLTHDAGGGVTYIGYCKRLGVAQDKAEWLIIRVTVAGGITTPEYSEGSFAFGSKWSDRATINYSR